MIPINATGSTSGLWTHSLSLTNLYWLLSIVGRSLGFKLGPTGLETLFPSVQVASSGFCPSGSVSDRQA